MTKKVSAKNTENLKILLNVSQTIGSTLNLQEILHSVVETVADITGSKSCLIYLYEAAAHELVLRASKNPHPRILGRIRLKLGEGITGWVAREKKGRGHCQECRRRPPV